MAKNKKLTELLTQDPPDIRKLLLYSRSKKKFDNVDLGKLAVLYHDLKKKHSSPVTPLHVACWSCTKPEVVRTLVNEGWNVNNDVGDFGSPLGVALDYGNLSIANLLIELGADVRRFYRQGFTPMFFALSTQKKEKTCVAAVKLLLKSGVSVNAVVNLESKERPIHIAVGNELPSVVSFLLQKGADLNIQDKDGFTPIHIAVHNNHLEMVKLLLLHGVDLYKENHLRETPLLIAVKSDFSEIVKELAKGGCDINRTCSRGATAPFHTALYFHRMEMVKLLVALGANPNKAVLSGTTPLHVVATRNLKKVFTQEKENSQERKDMAEYLVDNGAVLNTTDECTNTPLQVAIGSGFLSLAKMFVKLGADFSTRNDDGDTIFHLVVPLNRDIIILLLEFGGDYQAYNEAGLTPYHLAISYKVDLKYIKSFVKHGCPYDQNLSVWTNLVKTSKVGDKFFASEKNFFKGIKENNLELVKSSVMNGAVPTSCCEDMKYPLHFIALEGYKELLTFLLEENVQPNTLNEEGKTPLYLAANKGHYDTCRILLRYGACYNYQSKKCPKTPRMVASELKHNVVVDLFDSVDGMFHKARSKKKRVMKYLENKLGNHFDYLMYVSVIDMRGNTVLTTALQHKQNGNAEDMLKMKLQFNLGSNL